MARGTADHSTLPPGPRPSIINTEWIFTTKSCACAALGQKCALATIVQVNGSIPSFESAKLLVREDGSMMGTVGGGCVEAEVWNAAREVHRDRKAATSDPSAWARMPPTTTA